MESRRVELIREERSPLLWHPDPPDIYIGSAGHLRMGKGPTTHPLTAYYIALIWGVDGTILIPTPEETYTLEKGQVCLLSHDTRFSVDIDSEWGEFIYFSIDGKGTEGILETYDLWQGIFFGGEAPVEAVAWILPRLVETGESSVRTSLVGVLDLLELIRKNSLRLAPDKVVLAAEILIRQNWQDPCFGVNQICDQLQVHRSGLSKRFRDITGVPPRDYLQNIRIRAAVRMLEATGMNISEIAYACGFGDAGYFARFLKKKTGKGPGGFRMDLGRADPAADGQDRKGP